MPDRHVRLIGLLDVTSDAREASPLAYALAAQAAGAIERLPRRRPAITVSVFRLA